MKEFPGPGKYETIDMLGTGKDFYNSKFKTQKQKSFNGGDRFSKGSYLFMQRRELLALLTTRSATRYRQMGYVCFRP